MKTQNSKLDQMLGTSLKPPKTAVV